MQRKNKGEESSVEKEKLIKLEEKIIENLVELQRVHTALAEKFDKLANHIGDLLGLFENAARSFVQYPANAVSEKDREFLEKIDRLLDQNKTIAKGLTLMEERIRERLYGAPRMQEQSIPVQKKEEYDGASNRPLPKF